MTETTPSGRIVLHVLNGVHGGAATTTMELARALTSCGWQSAAYCHSAGAIRDPATFHAAFPVGIDRGFLYIWNRRTRTRTWRRPAVSLRQLVRTGGVIRSTQRVAEVARRRGTRMIHTQTFLNLEGAIAAQSIGVPHVWHVRELIGRTQPFRFFGESGEALARILSDSTTAIVANSAYTKRTLCQAIPLEDVRIIPNGFAPSDYEFKMRSFPVQRRWVVGMVGSPTATWKAHLAFIQCAREFREIDAEFVIYGSLPARDSEASHYYQHLLATIDRLGISDRLRFAGHVPMRQIMADLDILVQPTCGESFGRVVVEAMLSGVPTVGVGTGTYPELVTDGKTGTVAAGESPLALAAALRSLMGCPELYARLSHDGRTEAVGRYSLESCARKVNALYDEVATHDQPPLGIARAWKRLMPDRLVSCALQALGSGLISA